MYRLIVALLVSFGFSQATFATTSTSLRPLARPDSLTLSTRPAQPVAVRNDSLSAWVADFYPRARAAGISSRTLDRAFAGVTYDADVIRRDSNQSEFSKAIWEYLDSAASQTRIRNGRTALEKHKTTLREIEARYGVDKEIEVPLVS